LLDVGFGGNDALALGLVGCLYRVEIASTVAYIKEYGVRVEYYSIPYAYDIT
jgi:hypothetical protein